MDKLVILILFVFGVAFSSFAQSTETGDYEWQTDYQFAYDINGVKYYEIDADTLTVVNLNIGWNYMAFAVMTNSPYPKPAYLEEPKFEIPMKWDFRRLDNTWHRGLYHFYPEEWHLKVPSEDLQIEIVYGDSPYSAKRGSRKLTLKIISNGKPKIGNNQEFSECVCPPLDPIIIE